MKIKTQQSVTIKLNTAEFETLLVILSIIGVSGPYTATDSDRSFAAELRAKIIETLA